MFKKQLSLCDHGILSDKLSVLKGFVSCGGVGGSTILSLFLDARFSTEGNLTHFIIEVTIVDVND